MNTKILQTKFYAINLIALAITTALTGVLLSFLPQPVQAQSCSVSTEVCSEGTDAVDIVETSNVSGLSGLPSGLPVSSEAEIIRNYTASIGEGGTQRVLIYDTNTTLNSLLNDYVSWVSASGFSVDDERKDAHGIIRASQESQELIIAAFSRSGTLRVQINYIKR